MNGKMSKRLRLMAGSRTEHRKVKRAYTKGVQGQHPKPLELRKHKRAELIPPTWPHTIDQHLQSRPIIVARPWRRYIRGVQNMTRVEYRRIRVTYPLLPKHQLDALAVNS